MSVQIWLMGEAGLVDPTGAPLRLVSRRAWGLLAYLVRAGGRGVARADLAEMFWPERGEEQARASLRQELAVTRKALRAAGLDPIEAGKESVRFPEPQLLADSAALERLAEAGGLQDLRAAVALYRGPLLDGLTVRSDDFMDWLEAERERLNALAAGAMARLLEAELDNGDAEAVIVAADAWLALDPAAEPAHRARMEALAEAGQLADALRQFDICAAALKQAGGGDPAPETMDLAAEIRALRTAPAKQPAAPPAGGDPMSERGIGSILVAQLPQIADLAPGFEPAAVARAQNRFTDFAARVAEDAGGWLLPGPGDRVVIVFAEESEAAAGLAALMLAGEPVPLDQSQPVSPACGLSRGTLIVSEGGSLAGVALQAAARAAALARPGEALASAAMAPDLAEELTIAGGPNADFVALAIERPEPAPTPEAPPRPDVSGELVSVWQGWGRAIARADLRAAAGCIAEAQALPGEGAAFADVMSGACSLLRGRLAQADESLSRVQDLYSSSEPFGLDPGLTGRALMAWNRCLSGAPGAGAEALRRILSEAQGLRHPPTTLLGLLIAALVQDDLGETRAAFRSANNAYQAADGKPQWQALALACVGRSRDRIGEAQGADHLAEALKRYRGSGGLMALPLILGWMAASRLETGAAAEGLALVDEALGEGAATGVTLLEPELLRLQAMLLARQGRADRGQIEASFVGAIDSARRSGAGLYELRASVSFAGYLRGLGRLRDAIGRLDRGIAAVVPGGQVTADMKSAQALRHRLALG